jgi:hypothetical protein
MVNIGVFYRYSWSGQSRAMHAQLVDDVVTVNEADPITCEHTELVGVFAWVDNSIVGEGLSDTRRQDITEMLNAALQGLPL